MPLQIGIIGYGYMGEIRHRTLIQHKNIDLSMICETNKKILFDEQNITVVRNPLEVIESNVDAVFICTPNHLIPKLAIECLERGKHVFCEKPPGRTLEDIVQMRNAENRNLGTKLMFGFNHRYHPGVLRAKSIVDSGRMGKIIALRGLYGKSGGKNFDKSWRNDFKISGGGILLDQGIHMIDLFRYFSNDEFECLSSHLTSSFWNVECEDNAFLTLKSKNDIVATLHSSATQWKHKFLLEMAFENGYINLDGILSSTRSYAPETMIIGKREFEDITFAMGKPKESITYYEYDNSWELELKEFIDAVNGKSVINNGTSEDALEIMMLTDFVYKN